MLAVKAPTLTAAPLSVKLSDVVGLPAVFQHTPWAEGLGMPRFVMFPLPVAVVVPISVTVCVVTCGACGRALKLTWLP